jgi:outer membrane protein TolC
VLFSTYAFAQPSNAVDELARIAIENNPSLKAQRAKVRAAGEVPSQARALPDPSLNVEFFNFSPTIPNLPDALYMGLSLGVEQMLPWPGKRDAMEAEAKRKIDVEQAKLFAAESMLRGQVASAAYKMAMLSALLDLNDQQRQALETAAKTAAAVYASGMGSQADVLLAQTAATRLLSKREGFVEKRNTALARLESLLGGPADPALVRDIAIPDPASLPPLDDLVKTLPETSPAVQLGRAEELMAASAVEVAKLEAKPEFSVGARYRFHDPGMDGEDVVVFMFGTTIPWFQRETRYGPMIQEARVRREAAAVETENALNTGRYALTEAYRSAEKNLRVFGLTKDALLIQAKQAYESTLAAYGVGKVNFAALLMTLSELFDTQGDIVMARADYAEAVAMIDSILGKQARR